MDFNQGLPRFTSELQTQVKLIHHEEERLHVTLTRISSEKIY